MKLRIGTRGSDLALVQTRLVCSLITQQYPEIAPEEVIIRTHGDVHAQQDVLDADWPMGGFVGAIERALLAGDVDVAVHSYKDLPTVRTQGLRVVAVPQRGPVHDVLVMREATTLDELPRGVRIGTSSPRRAAQMRQFGDVEIVPIRGNVPTRLQKVERGEIDGVVLAAAGLQRLALCPAHALDLPLEYCLPAPGQGALAVQMREGDERVEMLRAIKDADAEVAVRTERALMREIGGACATSLGAMATVDENRIMLRGQLFDADGTRHVRDAVQGDDSHALGRELAARLQALLGHTGERDA